MKVMRFRSNTRRARFGTKVVVTVTLFAFALVATQIFGRGIAVPAMVAVLMAASAFTALWTPLENAAGSRHTDRGDVLDQTSAQPANDPATGSHVYLAVIDPDSPEVARIPTEFLRIDRERSRSITRRVAVQQIAAPGTAHAIGGPPEPARLEEVRAEQERPS